MPAPKGNLYALALKNSGRPPFFKTPKELLDKCISYFEWVAGELNENGKYIRFPEPITITGLTLYLGFENRQSLYDYRDRGTKNEEKVAEYKEFSCIIKKAMTLVENAYEKKLDNDYCTGAVFALKNMKWSDSVKHIGGDADDPPVKIKIGNENFEV